VNNWHGLCLELSSVTKLTFYPIGRADSYLIEVGHKLILCDYANMGGEKACDLAKSIKEDMGWPKRKNIDVVAITHLDNDHVKGASDFFWFEAFSSYQSDERVKIDELWVPAAVITETALDETDAKLIRAEARHRLRAGNGIKVFSAPDMLDAWFALEKIDPADRRHCIVNAGGPIDTFDLERDGVSFFPHSPFAQRENGNLVDRNADSLVQQATFRVGGKDFYLLMTADVTHTELDRIVEVTEDHENDSKLDWHILKVPHHCSYKALADDKGSPKTTPTPQVTRLLNHGKSGSIMVITSGPVPSGLSEEGAMPPHPEALACYEEWKTKLNGRIVVTMSNPNDSAPLRTIIDIDAFGPKLRTNYSSSGAAVITATVSPRHG